MSLIVGGVNYKGGGVGKLTKNLKKGGGVIIKRGGLKNLSKKCQKYSNNA